MKIGIIGSGALAIAFANVLSDFNDILMWTKFEEEREEIVTTRENRKFLPNVKLKYGIEVTTDISKLRESEFIIIAIPFVAIKDVMALKSLWYNNQIICSTVKGIEEDTLKTTTQIIGKELNNVKVCAISGPSFAIEIVDGHPVHLMLASKDKDVLCTVKSLFHDTNLRLHETEDVVGIELCGAIKNAIAIGSGILAGLNAADSTRAAYLATGEREMSCILNKFNAMPKTAYSYAGIGDLILTCMSSKSRNYTFGKLLAEGKTVEEAFGAMNSKTVEGYKIIETLYHVLNQDGANSALIDTLYGIVFNKEDISNLTKI